MSSPFNSSSQVGAQARCLGLPVKPLDWAIDALHDGAIPSCPTAPRAATAKRPAGPRRAKVCSPATARKPRPLSPDAPQTARVGSPSAPRPGRPVGAAEAAPEAHPGLGGGSPATAEAQGAVADAALAEDRAVAEGCAAQQREAGPECNELIEDSQSYDVSHDEDYGHLSPVSSSMGPRIPPGRSLHIADIMCVWSACCIWFSPVCESMPSSRASSSACLNR